MDNQERVYTESEVKAIVLVERADARYQAFREIVNLAREGEVKSRNTYFEARDAERKVVK